MSEMLHEVNPEGQPTLAEELAAIPYEPLVPAEKWLIGTSLVLGIVLLALLSWVTTTYFPVKIPPKEKGAKASAPTSTAAPWVVASNR